MTLLEVRNLTKRFHRRERRGGASEVVAVDDVSFDVDAGHTVALVGESGAGKSTTAYLVLRLLEPDGGRIHLGGVDLLALDRRQLRKARKDMQIVFQDPHSSLDPRVPVGRSIAEPLRVLTDMNRRDREERALRMLDRVALSHGIANRYPSELSGGQLQRVAIARALTLEPRLIVCDEAVSALDVSVRAQVLNLLRQIQAEDGISYLFVSHDLSVVENIADYVVVMRNGRLVEQGASATIFTEPGDEYTKELLAAVPVPDPRLRERAVALQPG